MSLQYEWRTRRRQVKFCYRCRMLKSKQEFYIRNKKIRGYKYKNLDILCKLCMSEYRKEKRNKGDK